MLIREGQKKKIPNDVMMLKHLRGRFFFLKFGWNSLSRGSREPQINNIFLYKEHLDRMLEARDLYITRPAWGYDLRGLYQLYRFRPLVIKDLEFLERS